MGPSRTSRIRRGRHLPRQEVHTLRLPRWLASLSRASCPLWKLPGLPEHYGFRAGLFTRVRPSFFTGAQCRKRSESSQSAARSHDVCCRLVAARAPQLSGSSKALPHAIALGLVVKGKTPALHEANDIVLCQIEDKASEHIQ